MVNIHTAYTESAEPFELSEQSGGTLLCCASVMFLYVRLGKKSTGDVINHVISQYLWHITAEHIKKKPNKRGCFYRHQGTGSVKYDFFTDLTQINTSGRFLESSV